MGHSWQKLKKLGFFCYILIANSQFYHNYKNTLSDMVILITVPSLYKPTINIKQIKS